VELGAVCVDIECGALLIWKSALVRESAIDQVVEDPKPDCGILQVWTQSNRTRAYRCSRGKNLVSRVALRCRETRLRLAIAR